MTVIVIQRKCLKHNLNVLFSNTHMLVNNVVYCDWGKVEIKLYRRQGRVWANDLELIGGKITIVGRIVWHVSEC